ncbi:C6 transcription factor [Aspergillus eucalypticola CBS 122712]|uniref:C6 transcription factor n=1 Tax=Aspergillus eucalypticola (strain CBS 122712 / IBT 29274) TaxID=1448314 RepID=A0A317VZU3_ASPEC|nr:C6 transcription factor [Aspergillus eucalypticola CBS 122712]PWY79896.1 C6 transcription factor [Aspergillus eucalypticola CBS 122712]
MQNSEVAAGLLPSWVVQDNHPIIHKGAGTHSDQDRRSRRRNPLACEACYKKKVKCETEGSGATCIQCLRRNTTCKFTTRKEKRDDLKRAHYVRTLENRVKRTESILRAAGLLSDDPMSLDGGLSDEDDRRPDYGSDSEDESISPYFSPREVSSRRSSGALTSDGSRDYDHLQYRAPTEEDAGSTASHATPSRQSLDPTNSSKLPEDGSSSSKKCPHTHAPVFKLDSREDSRYYGRSSSLSILSREALDWIKHKTGEDTILNVVFSDSNSDNAWDAWRPEVFHDLFASQVFKPLPPRAEVFTLLRDYFRTVNRLFPLYDESSFMQLVEWQYTQQTCDDAARWASINIILSLAYEYRFSNCQKSEKDRERAWLYYKNAMSVFAELSLRRTDLLSVQALLGMAFFLRGNSGTQSALPIITAAMRICQRMGLHRNIPRPYLTPKEQEQRRRVFWIAYILDQSACVRSGSAPAQHFEDFDVDFPVDHIHDPFVKARDGSFFRHLCQLTVIKSRVFSKLYAAKALENKSPEEIYNNIRELHDELEEWKRVNALEFRMKQRGAGQDFLIGFASAGLQFVYYNTMIMIHRLPLMIQFASAHCIARGNHPPMDYDLISSEASASAAICVQAARDTVRLVNNLPWGDIAWIWSLLYYIFLAVMNIFVNILRDPQHKKVEDDLQSLNMAATFFATLIPGDGPGHYARFMTKMCANFERIARVVVERYQRTVKPSETKHHSSFRKSSTTAKDQKSVRAVSPQSSRTSTYSKSGSSPPVPSSVRLSIDIPNLEGLPPVNSAGYVVPDDLTPSPVQGPTFSSHPVTTTTTQPLSQSTPAPPSGPPRSYDSSLPTGLESPFFPITVNSDGFNFSQPELWQIPLTADWEVTPHALGSLFGPDFNYLFPQQTDSSSNEFQPTSQVAGQPMTTAPAPMEFAYANTMADAQNPSRNRNRSQHGGVPTTADQPLQENDMWMAGMYSNPYNLPP